MVGVEVETQLDGRHQPRRLPPCSVTGFSSPAEAVMAGLYSSPLPERAGTACPYSGSIATLWLSGYCGAYPQRRKGRRYQNASDPIRVAKVRLAPDATLGHPRERPAVGEHGSLQATQRMGNLPLADPELHGGHQTCHLGALTA